jgi:4-amino-4-deoxy-L-arabinose transferase-like glycosyltransferase
MLSNITARQTRATDQSFGPVAVALLAAVALIAFRIALAGLDRTELSTDEAQYWFWGQDLDFGAYSKPPLIGWIVRLSTDLFGQSVWAVRLPAILCHAATSAVIFAVARRLAPPPVPALAAMLYLLSPAVTLGSSVMTTDTPLLLAAALALLAQHHLGAANSAGRRAPAAAVVLGLALGLGLLSKYAMLIWLAGSVGAAVLSAELRPGRADARLAFCVMIAVIAPHLVWLWQHGFITLQHVQDITQGDELSILRPLQFLTEQLLVAGPIVFVAMGISMLRDTTSAGLAVLVLIPLVIVLAQGVKGPVLANWAVLYLVPGSILAAHWLASRPRLAFLSLFLGLVVAVSLPLLKAYGTDLHRPDGRPLLARYLGHSEIAHWALDAAAKRGARVLIARDRDLLADLSWFSTGTVIAIRAIPPHGRPAHQWEMTAPFDGTEGPKPLLLLRADALSPCPDARKVDSLVAPPGFAGGDRLVLFSLPHPACLRDHQTQEEPA